MLRFYESTNEGSFQCWNGACGIVFDESAADIYAGLVLFNQEYDVCLSYCAASVYIDPSAWYGSIHVVP